MTKIVIYEKFCYKGIGKFGKEALGINCQTNKHLFDQHLFCASLGITSVNKRYLLTETAGPLENTVT